MRSSAPWGAYCLASSFGINKTSWSILRGCFYKEKRPPHESSWDGLKHSGRGTTQVALRTRPLCGRANTPPARITATNPCTASPSVHRACSKVTAALYALPDLHPTPALCKSGTERTLFHCIYILRILPHRQPVVKGENWLGTACFSWGSLAVGPDGCYNIVLQRSISACYS